MPYEHAPPDNFLGLPPEHSAFDGSRVLVLPVPYEATTSYGGGTKNGPRALLEASRQVELYDREWGTEPALEWGVHTLPALSPNLSSQEAALADIEEAVAEYAASGKLPCVLGGEHAVSVGVARGLRRVHGDFVTVQLDAHADLRDTYEGSPYSHACAMRRVCAFSPVVGLGIRSLDITEAVFLREHPEQVTAFFADEMHRSTSYLDTLAERIRGQQVYLTIDVDALDPSIMPSTGTPEPGGLLWGQMLDVVRTVAREARVIGLDMVELAPIPGLHAPNFLAAKLLYKTLCLLLHEHPDASR